MVKKIVRQELLTPAELEEVAALRAEWMRAGYDTRRADRKAAEVAVDAAYRAAGLASPPVHIWMDSPLGGVVASRVLRDQLRDQLGDQLRDQLGGQLWGQLGGQLRDQLGGQLRGQLGDQLGGQLWGQLWGQLGGQLWGQLWGQLGGQLGDQLWDQLGVAVYGPQEAYWLAFYAYGLQLVRERSERLDTTAAVARECGWWWPMEGCVVLTDRPEKISIDEEGRLHCQDGPAVRFADGWSVWAWHGLRVSKDVIEGPLTKERILGERNAEVRRVMYECLGAERYVGLLEVAPVHRDDYGTLYRATQDPDEDLVVVQVVNSTAEPDGRYKDYWLRVPPGVTTAREAVAWTFDVPASAYELAAES